MNSIKILRMYDILNRSNWINVDTKKRIILNGREYKTTRYDYNYYLENYGNTKLLNFKGKDVYLHIENTDPEIQYTTGLSSDQLNQILFYIEEKLNFILWNQHQKQLILTQLEN